jgi:RNA polymerase sigma-70 factor (ECF subfamily)
MVNVPGLAAARQLAGRLDVTMTDPLPDDATDDRELMQRACQGDREAFAGLVRRHQRLLLNFFRRCGVQTDAEDLVQQTFIRLYRYRDRYTPRAKLTTFLYLLARQVWIDELRRRQRAERLRKGLEAEPPPEPAQLTQPEHGSMDIAAALAALPEGLRLVVVMGIYQNMAYADIGAALGIPVGTVKSRMFNALRLLRRMMEETENSKQ